MSTIRFLAIVFCLALIPSVTQSADRQSGYYCSMPQLDETYKALFRTLEQSGKRSLIAFVTGLTDQMLQNPYPPEFAICAKGTEAEKWIFVAARCDVYNTKFRMRGLLATLTRMARLRRLFKKAAMQEFFAFFDLCKMLSFARITVSDGRSLRIALSSSKKSFDV